MNIGFIAHNEKKELMQDFCVAYKNIIGKHKLYATSVTGRRIEEATSLRVHKLLPGALGGDKQLIDMITRGNIDAVIFFPSHKVGKDTRQMELFRVTKCCDRYNVPVATNIGTAESLVRSFEKDKWLWRT